MFSSCDCHIMYVLNYHYSFITELSLSMHLVSAGYITSCKSEVVVYITYKLSVNWCIFAIPSPCEKLCMGCMCMHCSPTITQIYILILQTSHVHASLYVGTFVP